MNRNQLVLSILLVPVLLLAMGISSFAVPIQAGDQIKISGLNPAAVINGGRGGPYSAVVTSTGGGYSTRFLTFCLEMDEYLDFSSTFIVGGVTSSADGGGRNTDSGDPLDPFTAYLYTKAVSGGYDDDRLDDVQFAIWRTEDEICSFPNSSYADFYQQELNIFNSLTGWNGGGNVQVINLKDQWGNNAQDLIVSVPEAPAVATLILGMGLIGFAGYYESRTRFRRS